MEVDPLPNILAFVSFSDANLAKLSNYAKFPPRRKLASAFTHESQLAAAILLPGGARPPRRKPFLPPSPPPV